VGESKALNENLVKLQALNDLKGIKIPDNDISLKIYNQVSKTVIINREPIGVFIFNNAFQISL
jgi:hypothetical protein